MNRREFLRTAGGAAGVATAGTAATGSAIAQEDGGGGNESGGDGNESAGGGNESSGGSGGGGGSGPVDYGGWLEDAKGWGGEGSSADKTGQDEVTIKVGAGSDGMAFEPAGVEIDPGTKVIWEWTGEGGAHNVVGESMDFESGSPTSTGTYEKTFEEDGVVTYYCEPHETSGMKGALAVGEVKRKSAAAAAELDPHEMGVPLQPHYVGFGALLMMATTLVFTFYQLKYGESANTKGGNS